MEVTARLQTMMRRYNISEKDVAYCDLINAGWGKTEAAFFALHLAYADKRKIQVYMSDYLAHRPGIQKCIEDLSDESERKKAREERLQKREESERIYSANVSSNMKNKDGVLEKDDLAQFYSDVMRDARADVKTKMDAAKGLADLQQMKKELTQAEDNRVHFFLPLSCSKCSLYIKQRNEQMGIRETAGDGTAVKRSAPKDFL